MARGVACRLRSAVAEKRVGGKAERATKGRDYRISEASGSYYRKAELLESQTAHSSRDQRWMGASDIRLCWQSREFGAAAQQGLIDEENATMQGARGSSKGNKDCATSLACLVTAAGGCKVRKRSRGL